ncbi:MAG: hypothetical protein GQE15_12355 [Archangiaceae bacterium]|nr:hypothetical protein [Archangiaceae bacterium]
MKRILMVAAFTIAACGVEPDDAVTTSATVTTTSGVDGGSACADTWSAYGSTFFAANCNRCHPAQYQTQASVKASLSRVTSEISRGSMPEGFALSAMEKARVLTYLRCGAP